MVVRRITSTWTVQAGNSADVLGCYGDSSSRDRLLKAMWVQKFERKGCDPPLQAEGEFNTDPRVKI